MQLSPLRWAHFALVCAFTLTFALPAAAQNPNAPEQQYMVLGLSVVGNKTADAAGIISQSGLYRGQHLTMTGDAIHTAMDRLWDMGIFDDVQIVTDRTTPQSDSTIGLFLSVHVHELPHLGEIVISGNKEIKTGDLEKTIGIKTGDMLRPWDVASAKNRMQAMYEKQGYHFAAITTSETWRSDSSRADLNITINEGKEMIVRHIDFTGNEHVPAGDLRSAMEDTKEKKWWKIFSSGAFDDKKYEDDKKKIIDYYHSHGYRDAAIVSDSVWPTGESDLNILINLSEGPQYHVRNIAVSGAQVFTPDEVREHLGFHKGDIYDLQRLDLNMHGPTPDYSDVGSLYYDRGYIAQISKDESVVPGDSIDLVIRVLEGKQHFFRYVDVKGNTKTKEYVIRRELFTRPGDAFSRAAIIRSLRQLAQLNYFNQEKLQPDVQMSPDATDVDVVFNVEERSSDTFNASVGYGGSLGLTGSVGVSFNNFDITDPLHGGGGEVLSVSAEIGASAYRTLSLSFNEPWLSQTPTSLGFQVYTTHSEYVYIADRSGAALSLGRRLRWPDDYFRLDYTLSASHSNITNGGGIYTPGIHDETSIQQALSRASTDNPIFPTMGSEFSFITRIAYLPIHPDQPDHEPANYFRNSFGMKFFTPMLSIAGQNKLVLMTSADIGQIGGVGNQPFVPPTELFVMGGSGLATGIYSIPLRGYDDASIGVQKGTSTTSIYAPGGKAYSRYVAELRFILSLEPIPIYFLSFAEAGNVWADFSHADLFDLKRSLGVGARVQVPAVGMIGLDFGYGFDPRTAFGAASGWHTHFQFGRGF
jgi:outer membrane protein insertion porin family